LPEGYDVQRQVVDNVRMKQLEYYWWVLAIGAALILLIVLGLIWLVSRIFRRKAA
jgi:flagellar biogenesis protein FliO